MSGPRRIERPRGTHDVMPADMPPWRLVTTAFETLCGEYGYRPIQTPVFEDTDLFERTSGAASDIVRKEMYTFLDRSERSLTLRAEATAPIVRAYLEHGLNREPQPQKLFTIASIYRYGRPQRGRFREHWQLDAEAIGSDDPAVDAEVIQLFDTLLHRLGIGRYRLELNSIGDAACRPAYLERLRPWLAEREAELDAETVEQGRRNPLRALDNLNAKPAGTRDVLRHAPTIGDSLCDACREHFDAVRAVLDAYEVRYVLVPTLVRGLDYYTRTTWEFVPDDGGPTLSGGGRYDGLAEEIGGPPTPGVGFGAGIERLVLALEEGGVEAPPPSLDLFFAVDGGPRLEVLGWMAELRRRGVSCDTDYAGRSPKGQLTQARRLNATRTVIVGPAVATLRAAGEPDVTVAHAEIVSRLLA